MLNLATAAARAGSVAGTAWPRSGVCRAGKTNLLQLLERELAVLARSGKLADATIFMLGATDPYREVERRLGLTRRVLEALDIRRARDRRRFGAARNPKSPAVDGG
jgi:hypothetical protein